MVDPAKINSRADLHAALRQLFGEFGGSYLEAATAADSGVATVHEMVSGKRFPRWGTLRKVLCAFGIAEADLGAWKQAHTRAGRDDHDDAEPYQGLDAFEPEDVKYFFGRQDLIRLLRDRVSAQLGQDGILLVTGPSGAGTSSLLRAGLIPASDKSWPEGHVILTPSGDSVQTRGDPLRILALPVSRGLQACQSCQACCLGSAGLSGRWLSMSRCGGWWSMMRISGCMPRRARIWRDCERRAGSLCTCRTAWAMAWTGRARLCCS
ncbi:hypothetical protein [Nonomuraea sp. NPDC049695]|uniref:nSTAND1 domain-containing NTPase n=1 Tax=Nonomuraea sp. NPDC049695 TaxID=3154734 RepID=UPI00341747E4